MSGSDEDGGSDEILRDESDVIRPPAVRRGIADARTKAGADLDPGAIPSPHELAIQGSQASADGGGALYIAGIRASYAAARSTNPADMGALKDAYVAAYDALDGIHEAAEEIELAANSMQAAADDIAAAILELRAAERDRTAAAARAALEKSKAAEAEAEVARAAAAAAPGRALTPKPKALPPPPPPGDATSGGAAE